jgi:hypothetical protein
VDMCFVDMYFVETDLFSALEALVLSDTSQNLRELILTLMLRNGDTFRANTDGIGSHLSIAQS